MSNTVIPRSEYPRPDFQRESWLCLNGEWEFSFDVPSFDRIIMVPYACESVLSGIHDTGYHRKVWYRRSFVLPDDMKQKRILLHFGAVDYRCRVVVNGKHACEHVGGHSGFSADVTELLMEENTIVVEAEDDPLDISAPRGKQTWKEKPEGIFYTRTTGIWQSVWLEAVDPVYLESMRVTPSYDSREVSFAYRLSEWKDVALDIHICFAGRQLDQLRVIPTGFEGEVSVRIDPFTAGQWSLFEDMAWTPENPRLFDVRYVVTYRDRVADEVISYFGMRKISVRGGVLCLNDVPYKQRLVLDQGYWPEGIMTAPTDEDFVRDIQLTKSMGFNGVRKHQKVEDPRYLYHADRMGLLVWGEMASAYDFTERAVTGSCREWAEVIQRDYNHPCIVAWTALNESWGIQQVGNDRRQQAYVRALVNLIKSLDDTRPVIDNDGWEHVCGDLLTIHDYTDDTAVLKAHLGEMKDILKSLPGGRNLFVDTSEYTNQPVFLSEFGGIKYIPEASGEAGSKADPDPDAWGYSEVNTPEVFAEKLRSLMNMVRECGAVQGFCYTQLTDVETEQNGLLTYDRIPKIPVEHYRAIFQA